MATTSESIRSEMSSRSKYRCLHCKRELAKYYQGRHCDSKSCPWLKCACGALNDPTQKTAMHRDHITACQADTAPCQSSPIPKSK